MTIAALLCAAFAAWVSSGALTLLPFPASTPRAGLLPPPYWLVAGLLAALAAWRVRSKSIKNLPVLLLSGLFFLPWLPIRVPAAFLVWSGPLKIWIWSILFAAAVVPALAKRAPPALSGLLTDPRRAPRVAAALAAVLYCAGAWLVSPHLPAGDEPHYLVITQSLLRDHDIKVENNYLHNDYREYYAGALQPHYLRRGQNQAIYSVHAPGLPALVAPAFALFGYPAVLVFLSIVSAAGAALAWTAVWRLTQDAAASWFGWASVAMSAPFFFQAFTMYPDAPGGALLMLTIVALTNHRTPSSRYLVGCGAALALLPWLHTRFAVLACMAGLVLAARLLRDPRPARRLVLLLSIPAVSAAAWFLFFYVIYGTPDPAAPYNGYTQTEIANLARGIPGLLIDQQFGLLPNAPVYLCAALGFVTLARRRPRLVSELMLVMVPYVLAVAAYQMWWAGYSSPARFLAPVLLPCAIPAGVWFAAQRSVASRLLGILALVMSVLITVTIAIVERGALVFNVRDGASRLLLWLSPLVNLTAGLPSLFQTSALRAVTYAVIWLCAIATLAGIARLATRRESTPRLAVLTTGAAAVALAMLALTIVWRANRIQPLTPDTANAALRRELGVEPRRAGLGIRFAPVRLLPPSELLLASSREQWTRSTARSGESSVLLPYPLAATYEIDASIVRSGGGRMAVTLDREFGPAWSWTLPDVPGHWRQSFTVPTPATGLLVTADAQAKRIVDSLSLRAVGLVKDGGVSTKRPLHAVRYGPAVVLLLSGHVYMEPGGAWMAGGSDAEFAIQPDPDHAVMLLVRNAPIPNHLRLESNGWREELTLAPREERVVTVPATSASGAVLLRAACSSGVRPSEVEPSEDTRLLGCWLETR